jgi:hypothetical protein
LKFGSLEPKLTWRLSAKENGNMLIERVTLSKTRSLFSAFAVQRWMDRALWEGEST